MLLMSTLVGPPVRVNGDRARAVDGRAACGVIEEDVLVGGVGCAVLERSRDAIAPAKHDEVRRAGKHPDRDRVARASWRDWLRRRPRRRANEIPCPIDCRPTCAENAAVRVRKESTS